MVLNGQSFYQASPSSFKISRNLLPGLKLKPGKSHAGIVDIIKG